MSKCSENRRVANFGRKLRSPTAKAGEFFIGIKARKLSLLLKEKLGLGYCNGILVPQLQLNHLFP